MQTLSNSAMPPHRFSFSFKTVAKVGDWETVISCDSLLYVTLYFKFLFHAICVPFRSEGAAVLARRGRPKFCHCYGASSFCLSID